MNRRREFAIAFVGLKPGQHEFNYSIDEKFFEAFQKQDFNHCKANIKLTLDKKSSFMMLKFEIGGVIEVTCDRCNNTLPLDLWDEFNMTVKMVEEPELMNQNEEDPDMYYISLQESHLHIENWIYEFINLSLPMQRACHFEKMDGPHCNAAAREMLLKMESERDESTSDSQKQETKNPIWKGLDKLKF
ncbi:MAG: DUF177 domain-containing protein [Chitinophagaceae bacterium]|nr:DUF177 domain-containing protein [Chitinophagaceae bacterium]